MPRFAISRHESPRGLHWDLFLEDGDTLRTWALPQTPQPGATMICDALPEHRLAYLDYEGAISDGRGAVSLWDRGSYAIQQQSDAELILTLRGQRLAGRVVLERLAHAPGTWKFFYEPMATQESSP